MSDNERVKTSPDTAPLDERARYLRRLIVEMLASSGRGHLAPAMSIIDIIRVLYDNFMKYDATQPSWSERDRFILSKGHGCMALYAILADKGFFPMDELQTFCSMNSRLGGHPESLKLPGVEASTGSLGHGLSIGVGMALAARIEKKSHRVIVLMGDGEVAEGSVWEAAMCASKHRLSNLIALIDYNRYQSYGPVKEVLDLEPLTEKFRAFGFDVDEVNGHEITQLKNLFSGVSVSGSKPRAVICHTVKGKGIPFAENSPEWHHKSRLSDAEREGLFAALSGDSK